MRRCVAPTSPTSEAASQAPKRRVLHRARAYGAPKSTMASASTSCAMAGVPRMTAAFLAVTCRHNWALASHCGTQGAAAACTAAAVQFEMPQVPGTERGATVPATMHVVRNQRFATQIDALPL